MRPGVNSLNVAVTAAIVLYEARRQRGADAHAASLMLPLLPDDATPLPGTPLAERMRPRTLDEFVGQAQLLGPGRPLRQALDAARCIR